MPLNADAAEQIAIVGLAGRFPGADDVDTLWNVLRDGCETISRFSDEELIAAGVDARTIAAPDYVKAKGVLTDIDMFDASFFGINGADAELLDPQHRLLLETAWQALESAACDPQEFDGRIGLFAGCGLNSYFLSNLTSNVSRLALLGGQRVLLASDKDYLAARVSYHLNLTGPAVVIQSACSSSLVAVHFATQSLLNGDCDLAIAGGVSILLPHIVGYLYQEGGILSKDGSCRAFDAQASGTVCGEGVGLVVLKRLTEAIADGDPIRAVILGSAVNNDGAQKIGFTAPSVQGQAAVIASALAVAQIDPDTVTYIQAHGTGTALGDPIEVAALTQVYSTATRQKASCALGSVKTNIGHLDTAAGVAGLIAATLALEHGTIPPTVHYKVPNSQINLVDSPFYINSLPEKWNAPFPKRVGVSSFGLGGTNAHVILQEAPSTTHYRDAERPQLLVLSAKSASGLRQAASRLANYCRHSPPAPLSAITYTLQTGRRHFAFRYALRCSQLEEVADALESASFDGAGLKDNLQDRPVAFAFSGQGSQYVEMGADLYRSQPVFRDSLDRCCNLFNQAMGLDISSALFPNDEQRQNAETRLNETILAQPALFAIEYSLAQLWMDWGVTAKVMVGHSIGEYVAACISGVFSLEEAVIAVAARAQLMQQLPRGGMLAIALPESDVIEMLGRGVDLAAINGRSQCVLSGPNPAIEKLEGYVRSRGVVCQRLQTSHAFHSMMMDDAVTPLRRVLASLHLRAPEMPFVSTVTGTWIRDEEAKDPDYWARQMRLPVRFADAIAEVTSDPAIILLEVGPGTVASTAAASARNQVMCAFSMPYGPHKVSESAHILDTVGKLWVAGTPIKWKAFRGHDQSRRVSLPTYQFERKRYWIDSSTPPAKVDEAILTRNISLAGAPSDWLSLESLIEQQLAVMSKQLSAMHVDP